MVRNTNTLLKCKATHFPELSQQQQLRAAADAFQRPQQELGQLQVSTKSSKNSSGCRAGRKAEQVLGRLQILTKSLDKKQTTKAAAGVDESSTCLLALSVRDPEQQGSQLDVRQACSLLHVCRRLACVHSTRGWGSLRGASRVDLSYDLGLRVYGYTAP